jgi:hypothetical protein
MDLDFRKLERSEQIKAINDCIEINDVSFLAYLMASDSYDVYGWFSFDKTLEGSDYWIDLANKQRKDNLAKLKTYEVFVALTLGKTVEVEAYDKDHACAKAKLSFENGDIQLHSEDQLKVDINILND